MCRATVMLMLIGLFTRFLHHMQRHSKVKHFAKHRRRQGGGSRSMLHCQRELSAEEA